MASGNQNSEIAQHGKQEGKAHYSRAVATVRWLERSRWRPDGRNSDGFQDFDRLNY